jgi:hypothetical protein
LGELQVGRIAAHVGQEGVPQGGGGGDSLGRIHLKHFLD